MFIDAMLLKAGLTLLIVGVLVGAVVWSPAYAVAVAGFLLVALSEAV